MHCQMICKKNFYNINMDKWKGTYKERGETIEWISVSEIGILLKKH